jgi:hypothetical protein
MTENTELKSQIEDLCKANSIQYHFKDDYVPQVVLINDEFVFNYDTNIDMDNIECYVNIITGKNEMVNTICKKLNSTIKDGCIFEAYEFYQGEDGCVNNNTITMYFPYKNLITFVLKIYVGHRTNKYYLVNKDKTEVRFSKEMLDEKCYE